VIGNNSHPSISVSVGAPLFLGAAQRVEVELMVCDGEGAWVVAAVLKEKVINRQGSYDRDRGLAASVAFGPLRITSPVGWTWGMGHASRLFGGRGVHLRKTSAW
jgi:hypothetical protein